MSGGFQLGDGEDGKDFVSRSLYCRLTASSAKSADRLLESGVLQLHETSARGRIRYTLESVAEHLKAQRDENIKHRQSIGGMGLSATGDAEAKTARQMKAVADVWVALFKLMEQADLMMTTEAAKDEVARMLTEASAMVDQLPALISNDSPKGKRRAHAKLVREKLAIWRQDCRDVIRQAAAESSDAKERYAEMLRRISQNKLPEVFEDALRERAGGKGDKD